MNEAYFKARAARQARVAGRLGDYNDYLREQADGYAALQAIEELPYDIAANKLRPYPIQTADNAPLELELPGGGSRLFRNDPGPGRAGRILHPRPGTPEFLEYAGVYGEPVIEVFTPNGAEGYTLKPISGKTGKPITERGAKSLQTKHEKMLAQKRGPIHTSVESHEWSG